MCNCVNLGKKYYTCINCNICESTVLNFLQTFILNVQSLLFFIKFPNINTILSSISKDASLYLVHFVFLKVCSGHFVKIGTFSYAGSLLPSQSLLVPWNHKNVRSFHVNISPSSSIVFIYCHAFEEVKRFAS